MSVLGLHFQLKRAELKYAMAYRLTNLRASPKAAKTLARGVACLCLAIFGGPGAIPAQAQVPDSKPTGYVSDFAGVLSPQGKQKIEALATELNQKTGAQLAVVTVNSLDGEPMEDFSVDLATRWGIGSKERGDTGVLLLLAIQDRRNRVEVGYGLEPILPDGKVGGILRGMQPLLRAGDYDGALWQAAGQIAGIIARDANITLTGSVPQSAPQRSRRGRGFPLMLLFLIFGLPFLMRPRRRRAGWRGPGVGTGLIMGGILGSMLGGGGRGGGGFSSGGFGGFGGGGFGGGGASGSW
jgi:uncharacterized protein